MTARATYVYDVIDNRQEADEYTTTGGTTSTRFAYDGLNVWADLNTSNALVMRRIFGDMIDQVVARITSGGVLSWYGTDHLGSVRDVINSTGTTVLDAIVYDAYGNRTSESTPANGDRYGFTGREWSGVIKLQFNRERWYDAATGRWVSEDLIGFGAGDSNLYRYVNNSTLLRTDPSGCLEAITIQKDLWNINDVLKDPTIVQSFKNQGNEGKWKDQTTKNANVKVQGFKDKDSHGTYFSGRYVFGIVFKDISGTKGNSLFQTISQFTTAWLDGKQVDKSDPVYFSEGFPIPKDSLIHDPRELHDSIYCDGKSDVSKTLVQSVAFIGTYSGKTVDKVEQVGTGVDSFKNIQPVGGSKGAAVDVTFTLATSGKWTLTSEDLSIKEEGIIK